MTMIKRIRLTPHEAQSLVHDGFYLKLIQMYAGETDLYAVYAIGGN